MKIQFNLILIDDVRCLTYLFLNTTELQRILVSSHSMLNGFMNYQPKCSPLFKLALLFYFFSLLMELMPVNSHVCILPFGLRQERISTHI